MTRTPVYPVYLKFAVTGYVHTIILLFYYHNNDAYTILNKKTEELGLHLTIRCFLLVFVPYAPLVPCGSGVFCFFGQIKECRPTADRSNENNEISRSATTLDAELPNAEPQSLTASCMVGILNVM